MQYHPVEQTLLRWSPPWPTIPLSIQRESNIYFSLESGESQLAAGIEYLGPDHFVYASDVPHWDTEFPENLAQLRNQPDLSEEVKEKILLKNAKTLFGVD